MMQIGFSPLFASISSLLVSLASWLWSNRFPGSEPTRQVRNHLREFSKVWLVLATYYAARAWLQSRGFPVEIDDSASSSPWAQYCYHIFAMLVCLVTNVMLLRVIGMIEHPDELREHAGQSRLHVFTRLRLGGALNLATEYGIYLCGMVSVAALVFFAVNGSAYRGDVVKISYVVGLAPSCALFFRLSRVYLFGVGVQLLGWVTAAYGFLQLVYPFIQPGVWNGPYHTILTLGKLTLGGLVVVLADQLVPKLPVVDDADGQAEADDARVRDVGDRIENLTKARLIVQAFVFGFSTLAIGTILTATVKTPIIALYLKGGTERAIGLIAATAVLFLLAALFQVCGYCSFFLLAFRVDWLWLSKNALSGLYQVGEVRQMGCVKIRELTALRRHAPRRHEHDKAEAGPRPNHRRQVILVHGVFSTSEQAWGLLPLLLLRRGDVERVQLLDYGRRASLAEGGINSCLMDIQSTIQLLADDHDGDTVVIGHSLGGLLAMRALTAMFGGEAGQSLRRVSHLVLIGVPLAGSPLAWLGLPWPWPKRLQWNSEWVRVTVEGFAMQFPPPGLVVGEAQARPSCSFLTGSRDNVAGSQGILLMIPGQRIAVTGWHSTISRVFRADSIQAKTIFQELNRKSRALRLAHYICAQCAGTSRRQLAISFELGEHAGMESACVHSEVATEAGQPITFPEHDMTAASVPRSVEGYLRQAYDATSTQEGWTGPELQRIPEWDVFWARLIARLREAADEQGLVRMDWGREATIYARLVGAAGFAVVLFEKLRKQRFTDKAA
jgi:pimeloyl-ACP methyl ester carboxylesterase